MAKKRKMGLREKDIPVLLAWSRNNMKRRPTGKALGIAPQTLDYHLRQIALRTGLDPKRFVDLIALLMTIQEKEEKENATADKT